MSEDWKVEYNANAEKHNKRVKSIREVRLPKSCTAAIDQAIESMSNVRETAVDGIYHGYNALTMQDIIDLSNALQDLKNNFEYRELRS